jgi:hypothetical protein
MSALLKPDTQLQDTEPRNASWPIINTCIELYNTPNTSLLVTETRRGQTNDATMLASGFTNAPITQLLLLGVVGSAIIASLTDTKYFLWIEVRPHLLDYWQYWRLLTWQLAYTNSAEVLFAAMTFYQLRVIERLWGSRKFAVGTHHLHSTLESPRKSQYRIKG